MVDAASVVRDQDRGPGGGKRGDSFGGELVPDDAIERVDRCSKPQHAMDLGLGLVSLAPPWPRKPETGQKQDAGGRKKQNPAAHGHSRSKKVVVRCS